MLSKSDGWLRRRGMDRREGCRGVPGRNVGVRLIGISSNGGYFGRTAVLNNQGHGPGGQQKDTGGNKHRNNANGEDITRVQIIALILHYLAFDARRRRRGRWRASGGRLEQYQNLHEYP